MNRFVTSTTLVASLLTLSLRTLSALGTEPETANGANRSDASDASDGQSKSEPRASPAGAQSADDPEGVISESITVTASRGRKRSVYELPVSVSVLSRDEVESSPATGTDDLLRGIASVQLPLQDSDNVFPTNPSIAIRGLGLGDNATRTLVLVDGTPMNGAFFGNVFWNRVPTHAIERIEVVRGASSSLFGSYAMGGVLHLITRGVDSGRRLRADVRGGSHSSLRGSIFAGAKGKRSGGSINLDLSETGGFFEVAADQRGSIDTRNAIETSSLNARFDIDLGTSSRLYLRANAHDRDQDRSTLESDTSTQVWDVTAGGVWHLRDSNLVEASLHYLDERFRTDNISTVGSGRREEFVSNRHDTPSEDIGGSVRVSRDIGNRLRDLTIGADFRQVEGLDDADIFLPDGSLFQRKLGSGEQQSVGIFAEVNLAPRDDLAILVSLRQDFFDNREGRDTTNGQVTNFPDMDFDRLNSRVAVRYQASKAVGLRGALYRGFRSPTLAELYRAFGTATFRGLPNSQLDPETLTGAELGLDLAAGPFYGQINAFYNRVEDFVGGVAVAFFPIFTLKNENLGEIESQGLEMIGEVRFGRVWSLAANYVYTDAEIIENIDDPTVVGNRVEGAPEHTASVRLDYRRAGGLGVTLRGRFVDEQFQDSSNTTRLPSHAIFDLSADLPVGEHLELYTIVKNLFDREYVASAFGGLERRGAPFSLFGGIRIRFD